MAAPRDEHSVIDGVVQYLKNKIHKTLGVSAWNAIPPAYRPPDPDVALTYPLLAKLSELAILEPQLPNFQRRLLNACSKRPKIRGQVLWEDRFLQPRDVVLALEEDVGYPEDEPVQATPDRKKLKRSAKTEPGDRITSWNKHIRPTRKHLRTNSEPVFNMVRARPSSGRSSPIKVEKIELSPEASSSKKRKLRSSAATSQTSNEESHSQSTPVESTEVPSKRSRKSQVQSSESSYTDSEPNAKTPQRPNLTTVQTRRSRGKSLPAAEVQEGEIMPSQREHLAFHSANFSKSQHFKTLKPRVVDLTQHVDFDALTYPVEVRSITEKGIYYEFDCALKLRQYAEAEREAASGNAEFRQVSDPTSSESSNTPCRDVPSIPFSETPEPASQDKTHEHEALGLKFQLDGYVQQFTDSMFYFAGVALSSPGATTLSPKRRSQADRMRLTFIQAVKEAQGAYEAGLGKLGILPSCDSSEDSDFRFPAKAQPAREQRRGLRSRSNDATRPTSSQSDDNYGSLPTPTSPPRTTKSYPSRMRSGTMSRLM